MDATIQSPPDSTRTCCLSDCPARDVAVVAFWLVCFAIFFAGVLVGDWLWVGMGIALLSAGTLVLAYFWAASNFCGTSTPDFKPGTNAQRHRLHHAKHGSKHGSGRFSKILGSSGSQRNSGSVGAPAPAEPSDRAELPPALTWRASPPGRRKDPSTQV